MNEVVDAAQESGKRRRRLAGLPLILLLMPRPLLLSSRRPLPRPRSGQSEAEPVQSAAVAPEVQPEVDRNQQ
ncbi:MAG: hypothetical protein ACLTQI_06545 [Slackia sp.]